MIELIIRNGNMSYMASLTSSEQVLKEDIWKLGVQKSLSEIPLTDNKEDEVRVLLCSDQEVGKHLLKLLTEEHTLEDAYRTVQMVENVHENLRQTLYEKIIYDKYGSIEDLFQDVNRMTEETECSVEPFCFSDEDCGEEIDLQNQAGMQML